MFASNLDQDLLDDSQGLDEDGSLENEHKPLDDLHGSFENEHPGEPYDLQDGSFENEHTGGEPYDLGDGSFENEHTGYLEDGPFKNEPTVGEYCKPLPCGHQAIARTMKAQQEKWEKPRAC